MHVDMLVTVAGRNTRAVRCEFDFTGVIAKHRKDPYVSRNSVTMVNPTTPMPGPTTSPANGVSVTSAGCGNTKSCVLNPAGCEYPGNCQSMVAWTPKPTTIGGAEFVQFEMMAATDGWVAFALSSDTLMVTQLVGFARRNATPLK